MNAQIFLIVPTEGELAEKKPTNNKLAKKGAIKTNQQEGEIDNIYQNIDKAFSLGNISALLLLRQNFSQSQYIKLINSVLPLAHAHNCALLLDEDAKLAKQLGADGVHIGKDIEKLKNALKSLKPDMIVGVGNIKNRHDAMIKGELGADYLFFGSLADNKNYEELALWWMETTKVPAVYYLSDISSISSLPECDFIALNINDFLANQSLLTQGVRNSGVRNG